MLQLDLHGEPHCTAMTTVANWVLLNQAECPLLIVTGNSVEMQRRVNRVLTQLGTEHTALRQGCITVLRV